MTAPARTVLFLACLGVPAAVTYLIVRDLLHVLRERSRYLKYGTTHGSSIKAECFRRPPWGRVTLFVGVSVLFHCFSFLLEQAGATFLMLAVSAGFWTALWMALKRNSIEENRFTFDWSGRHPTVTTDRLRSFDAAARVLLRLAGPVGLAGLAMLPRASIISVLAKCDLQYGGEANSLAAVAVPAGILTFAAMYDPLLLLVFAIRCRSVLKREKKRTLRSVMMKQRWLWAIIVGIVAAASLLVYWAGEERVGRWMVAAVLVSYFTALPIWEGDEWNEGRNLFQKRAAGLLRLASLPAAWWLGLVLSNYARTVPVSEVVASVVWRGFCSAFLVLLVTGVFFVITRKRYMFRVRPKWQSASVIGVALAAVLPIAIRWGFPLPAALVALIAGSGIGFLQSWGVKCVSPPLIGTGVILWTLAATICISLYPLTHGALTPVMWYLCMLAVSTTAMSYGVLLKRGEAVTW